MNTYPTVFTEITELVKYLRNTDRISGATATSQLFLLQCGGGVMSEVRQHYIITKYGDEDFYQLIDLNLN